MAQTTPIKFKSSQREFVEAFTSKDYREILYAGTAGTGKSFGTACLLSMFCNDYPNTRLGIFRKNLTTARKTIWHTYIKAFEALGLEYESTAGSAPRFYLPESDSRIELFEMDASRDPDWNKIKGLELTLAHIEEANEVDVGGKNVLMSRIGRWNDNGAHACICMTCNPSQGWVRDDFREPWVNGTLKKSRAFIQSSKDELPPDYAELLAELPEAERERYVENNWDYLNDPHQLISYDLLKSNKTDEISDQPTRLGVDMARGGDKTVFCYATDNKILRFEEIDSQNEIIIGRRIQETMRTYGIDPGRVRIDSVGVGGGAVDYLHLNGLKTIGYNGGTSPDASEDYLYFKNRRAQDYWNLRSMLQNGKIEIAMHPQFVKEITVIRYFTKDRYIQIESKDDIKKSDRLGHSPDYADAAVMAMSDFGKSNFAYVV